MIYGSKSAVKYIPKVFGNDKSDYPATVLVKVISADDQVSWAESLKGKDVTDNDIFRFAVISADGIFSDEESGRPLTTADEILACNGLVPLVKDVVREFNRINIYGGQRKNVQ